MRYDLGLVSSSSSLSGSPSGSAGTGDVGSRTLPTLVGRYRVVGEIARGGMATVYLARLTGPGGFSKRVALKMLHPHFAHEPEFLAMLADEARLAANIQHPNVVSTLDVLTPEPGQLAIVMEYIHGVSLSKLRRSLKAPLPAAHAITIMTGALRGLHVAHELKDDSGAALGVIHRDISPQNILLGVDGVARVLDFGIAKAVDRSQNTNTGELKGKLGYMAPEVLQGGAATRQVDVYASAVVLWELLAGRRLFSRSGGGPGVFAEVISKVVDPPSAFAPGISPELDATIMRGLDRNPQQRYATAAELERALCAACAPISQEQLAVWTDAVAGQELARLNELVRLPAEEPDAPTPVAMAAEQPTQLSVSSETPKRRGSAPLRWALVAAALLAVTATLVVLGLRVAAEPSLGHQRTPLARNPGFRSVPTPQATAAPEPAPLQGATKPDSPKKPIRRPTVKPDPCNPPYSIDKKTGVKKYKVWCLRK